MKRTTVELGEVCDFLSGFAFKSELFSTEPIGLPIIRIRDVLPGSSATFYSGDYHPQYIIEKGDILIGMDGEFNRERWKSDVALLNQRVCKVIARERFVDNGYLYHALPMLLKKIEDETPFVTVKHLSVTKLKSALIPLPPLEEQRRIAAILDKCNDIQVADLKRSKTLERLQSSYFRHFFGEPSMSNASWAQKALASCSATIQTGPFGSLLHQSDYIQFGIPIINPKHIVNGVIARGENETIGKEKAAELSSYQLKEGDVLLARRGEMGRCAVVTTKENGWFCGTGSMFVRPLRDVLTPEYLCALLSSQYMRSKLEKIAIGTTLLNLNATIVGNLSIPVPPIDLQRRYANDLARLSTMGDMTSRSAHARSAAVASIQNKLLTAAGS